MIRRREVLALLGGVAVAWPVVARAQQPERVRRIGVLIGTAERDPEGQARLAALRQGLEKLDWAEGRNIRIEVRWSGNDPDRLRTYAAELVRLKPDVLFATSGSPLAALHRDTRSIPIVFAQAPDPVRGGFATSLARPGRNWLCYSWGPCALK